MYRELSIAKFLTIFIVFFLLFAGVFVSFISWAKISSLFSITNVSSKTRLALHTFNYKIAFSSKNSSAGTTFSRDVLSSLTKDFSTISVVNKKAQSVPVLVYHGIVPTSDRFNITPEGFKDQMFSLKKAGYATVTIQDFYDFMLGKKDLPDKSFLLTFDDGRKDSVNGADPILNALDYTAVMYVVTSDLLLHGNKNSRYYLNKKELDSMIASGRWQIESHAKQQSYSDSVGSGYVAIDSEGQEGNFLSNRMWLFAQGRLETPLEYAARIDDELAGSKSVLEELFNVPVISFAFPFGDYGQQSINFSDFSADIIRSKMSQSYTVAFHQVWGADSQYSFNYPYDDPLMAKRIEPSPQWSGEDLLSHLEAGRPKELPYTDSFTQNNGWKKWWGQFSINNSLDVSSASTSGAFIFLDGSYVWKDYIFSAHVAWEKGADVILAARFKDDTDYADCTFSDSDIYINQHISGRDWESVDKKIDFVTPKEDVTLGVLVNKDKIECLVNGNSVAYAHYLNSSLDQGGIGIKIWDPATSTAHIIVHEVTVLPITSVDGQAEMATLATSTLVKKDEPKKVVAVVKKEKKPKVMAFAPVVKESPAPSAAPEIPLSLEGVFGFSSLSANLWSALEGTTTGSSDSLILSSTASTSANSTILKGTKMWKNYLFTATVDWLKGSNFYLIGRFQDNKNYVTCSFSNYGSSVMLYQYKNGTQKTLGRSPRLDIPLVKPWENVHVGMKVVDNKIQCLINGESILKFENDTFPPNGGIGFRSWDKERGNSEVKVVNMKVEAI